MLRIQYPLPLYYIFLGNPGTGKSTLCNGLMGTSEFRAGVSFGSGLTTALQLAKLPTGGWVGDSPGLADPKIRDMAAREITKLLKSGEGEYKIMFVVTLEAGRVHPEDNVTMKLVLDAIGQPNGRPPHYGIIVNKLSKVLHQKLSDTASVEYQRVLASLNVGRQNLTTYILFYPKLDTLEDAENVVHAPQAELRTFLRMLPSVYLEPSAVKDVVPSEYEMLKEEYKKEIDDLRDNNVKLQAKFKDLQEVAKREMADVRKRADEMKLKLEEMAKTNDDAKKALKELEDRLREAENKNKEGSFSEFLVNVVQAIGSAAMAIAPALAAALLL
jgi:GTP-binding protein EngB required for normal cell division